jgi:Niemann-Pick C1 protein
MFIYVAFALGKYEWVNGQPGSLFVHSKFTLGICGIIGGHSAHIFILLITKFILGCVLSVSSSIGLFALFRMPASLIILEVEPFLVLAVGVDNIFIFVHSYQVATIVVRAGNFFLHFYA